MNTVRWTALVACAVCLSGGCAGYQVTGGDPPEQAAAPAPGAQAEAGGFSVTPPPAAPTAFVLPEPEPPGADSVTAGRPAAPGGQRQRPALPEPQPRPARAAAQQPPAVPVSGAAAAAVPRAAPPPAAPLRAAATAPAAATTRPAPPPAAPAAAPAAARQQAYARRGDDVQVSLEGGGWVFTGSSDPAIAEFRSRAVDRHGTVFAFRTTAVGTALLSFERQDGAGRPRDGARVELSVISPDEFAARVERGESSPELPTPERELVDRLIEARQYDDALRELTRLAAADAVYSNDRTAVIHMARGDILGARAHWIRNLPRDGAAPNEMQARALSGLLRIAVLLDDYAGVLRGLEPLRRGELPAADVEARSLEAGAYLLRKSNGATAIQVLDGLLAGSGDGRRRDEAYMLLAQAYEADGPTRDVKRAQGFYRRVYEGYPASRFAEAARDRSRYLDRHILLVQ